MWQIERCKKYCEKVEGELFAFLKQDLTNEQKLNLYKALIKVKFQKCAVLSQLNLHHKALEACRNVFPVIQEFLSILEHFIATKKVKEKGKVSLENILFIEKVYEFAQRIIHNLKDTLNNSFAEGKETFYYWAKNPEKNEEQVIKKYVGTQESEVGKRSILGVTKSRNWINEFNIGTIMHISQFHIEDFDKPAPIEEYVFRDRIYETVIYCSLAHFTLATEMRFIECNKEKMDFKRAKDFKPNLKHISRKYGYEEKTEAYLASEKHHLRAIDIIAKNIQFSIPYLAHIIRSYDKNYISNKPLEKITSIAEESALSVIPREEAPLTDLSELKKEEAIKVMNEERKKIFSQDEDGSKELLNCMKREKKKLEKSPCKQKEKRKSLKKNKSRKKKCHSKSERRDRKKELSSHRELLNPLSIRNPELKKE